VFEKQNGVIVDKDRQKIYNGKQSGKEEKENGINQGNYQRSGRRFGRSVEGVFLL
jgi:hypothetical protein